MDETHLEFMLKNSRKKSLKERYIEAKATFLGEVLSKVQEDVDRQGINQDIAFLTMMLYLQDFIVREVGKGYAEDIYARFAFTGWPFKAYASLLDAENPEEKVKKAVDIFMELEGDRIREDAGGYIRNEVLHMWNRLDLGSKPAGEASVKKVAEEKKRLYRRIGSKADLERRELVKRLADSGAHKTELQLLNIGIIPTELCPSRCRFCLSPWKSGTEERLGKPLDDREFMKMADEAVGFANGGALITTITGGEPIMEMGRVLYILSIAKTRVELTTSGFWARSREDTHRVLDALEKAVKSNSSRNFSFSLQLSVDFFHQEVKRGKNGELREGIPIENLANIVESVLTEYDLELCLLPKYTRYEDPLVFLFLELEKRGLKPRMSRKYYDPRLRVSVQGTNGGLADKAALLKGYLSFDSIDKEVFLLYTAVEGIGSAAVMEPFEFPAFKTRTFDFLDHEESQERFPITGLEVSDDGNVYPGAHALYSWCLGNLLETSLKEIVRNMEYDPLVRALAENPAAIKNEALRIEPSLRGELEKSSSPLVALYRILEDDMMRLKITRKLAENAESIP